MTIQYRFLKKTLFYLINKLNWKNWWITKMHLKKMSFFFKKKTKYIKNNYLWIIYYFKKIMIENIHNIYGIKNK